MLSNHAQDDYDDEEEAGGFPEADDDLGEGQFAAADGIGGAADGAAVPEGSYDNAIVLAEDMQLYPSAAETFPGVETLVEEEDAMRIDEPIIAPVRSHLFSVLEKAVPETKYSSEFMGMLLASPDLQRNVAVVGHLHHGKTCLLDMLIEQTHEKPWSLDGDRRYTDARQDEQARGVSIQATPVSLVLPSSEGKHSLVTLLDCPGHPCFEAETAAAARVCDGAMVVVDAVEGVMMGTERAIGRCVREGLAITLVIAKVDRLILELRLPPKDAYWKLQRVIDEANACIAAAAHSAPTGYRLRRLSPARGNVAFASATHRWCFTVQSIARRVAASMAASASSAASAAGAAAPAPVDPAALADRLWGDNWWDNERSCILQRRAPPGRHAATWPRTFVHFVLEPLYKVYAHALGREPSELQRLLGGVGVRLSKEELRLDPAPLLRAALRQWLGGALGVADMLVSRVPSPLAAAAAKSRLVASGPADGPTAQAVAACDASGPLIVNVVRLHAEPDGKGFVALGRVFSGTVRAGQQVRVLGEAYTIDEDEDEAMAVVAGVSLGQARYRIGFSQVPAGGIVLLEGVEATIAKTATLVAPPPPAGDGEAANRFADAFADSAPIHPLRLLRLEAAAVVRVSVEPIVPAELPKLSAAMRSISRSYLQAHTKTEESGEHVLLGTGELMMDCALHDLREVFGNGLEVRVSDPVSTFRETVSETSRLPCFARSPNTKNKLTMLADPLSAAVADEVESGRAGPQAGWEPARTQAHLQEAHGWDALAARGLWAFGPGANSGNALVDDTLLLAGAGGVSGDEANSAAMLRGARSSVVQGFNWAVREGPLCEEPMRGVTFRLLDVAFADTPLDRAPGQIIPAARRAAYSAFLMAEPRLMEPTMEVEVLAPVDVAPAVHKVLSRRRGHVVAEAPKPGTPFFVLRGFVPVMDSFGLETDLRTHTAGQAMLLQVFSRWDVVPGDPLDSSIELRPLEPQPTHALAREFTVKTRRRKGLAEDVTIQRFFDEDMLVELARHQAEAEAAADAAEDDDADMDGDRARDGGPAAGRGGDDGYGGSYARGGGYGRGGPGDDRAGGYADGGRRRDDGRGHERRDDGYGGGYGRDGSRGYDRRGGQGGRSASHPDRYSADRAPPRGDGYGGGGYSRER